VGDRPGAGVPGKVITVSKNLTARLVRPVALLLLVVGGAFLLGAPPPTAETAETASATLGFVAAFCILLLASGLVSSSETALFTLDKLDLSLMRGSPRWSERQIVRLLDRPNDTLITILILNNVVNISASLTAGAMTDRLVGQASFAAFLIAALVATVGLLLVGEILPKMLAHLYPRTASRLLAPPLVFWSPVLLPVRAAVRGSMRGLFRLFRIPETASGEDISEEELKAMISSGEISQVLEEDEREMIDGVFDLRRTTVDEILTPRLAVFALPDDLTSEEMERRLRECPHNRVPIYHESLDNLRGFILVKEVLLSPETDWRAFLREVICVPERVGLLALLKIFRRRRTKIAVVVDEYGGVAGIVTLQDLLEEIVGDIYEKHEQTGGEILAIESERWRVAGSMNLAELGEELEVSFPTELGRTAGGFVMNSLGRIPRAGDEIHYGPLRLRVLDMAGRRVHALEVVRVSPPRDGDSDPAADEAQSWN
jgi:putative hemolysin